MIQTGLDRLLDEVHHLRGRRYGIVSHAASVAADYTPIHLALVRQGAARPEGLFGPEHGFFGVEQDMVAAADGVDPWLELPLVSLYGESEASLRPDPELFSDLDLVVVDFQDVGSRYYTYAATAVWAAEAALSAGCEVWILDRPNPLGGEKVEGNLREDGFESFVGAFATPVRHALTLAELVSWALASIDADTAALRCWRMRGWHREMSWRATGRRWVAPSPNIPTPRIAGIYPGGCLIEGTNASEGRGTTRPFELFGSPTVDAIELADRLNMAGLDGARFLPVFFKPQFHKHAGEVCAGVQWLVEDASIMRPYRCGIEIIVALVELDPGFEWRSDSYEFVEDCPAIDLLVGSSILRRAAEGEIGLEDWISGWRRDEETFIAATEDFLLYEGERRGGGAS